MTDIEKVLAGRKLVDAYRKAKVEVDGDQPKLLDDLKSELDLLGFKSLEDFFETNKRIVGEDFALCVQIIGVCDGCVGRQRGCRQECYDWQTKKPRVTQAMQETYKAVFILGIRSERVKEYFALPSHRRTKGDASPILPGCSITVKYVADSALEDWR